MAEGARLESVYTRKCIEGSNPSLTAKFKEKAWIRVQAFFLHGAPPRGVCTAHLPTLCDRDSHFRRLSTSLTSDFLTLSWLLPYRSPQFSAKCTRLERTNKNTEIILDRIGPTPYSSAPLQR